MLTVAAAAWLVVGGVQLASLAVSLHATGSLVARQAWPYLALGVGALVALTAPALAWSALGAEAREKGRFPRGGLLLLAGLVAFRLGFVYVTGRGHSLLDERDADDLAERVARADVLENLPEPERGRPITLAQLEPIPCVRRLDELPTLFVTYPTRANDIAMSRSACLQEADLGALEASLRRHLSRSAARGPVRVDLVVRTAELAASPLTASWSLGDGHAGVCSAVACLLPWQLGQRAAFDASGFSFAGRTVPLGPTPDRLVTWLEPRRVGSGSAQLWRIETRSLGFSRDRTVTRLTPSEAWRSSR